MAAIAQCVMHTLMIANKMMNSAQQFVRAESKASEFMYVEACSILKSIDFLMVIANNDGAMYTYMHIVNKWPLVKVITNNCIEHYA